MCKRKCVQSINNNNDGKNLCSMLERDVNTNEYDENSICRMPVRMLI